MSRQQEALQAKKERICELVTALLSCAVQRMPLLKILSLVGVSDAEDLSSIFGPHHGESMIVKSSDADKKADHYLFAYFDKLHTRYGPLAIMQWLNDLEHAFPQSQKTVLRR
jgi:hypothetical protein